MGNESTIEYWELQEEIDELEYQWRLRVEEAGHSEETAKMKARIDWICDRLRQLEGYGS